MSEQFPTIETIEAQMSQEVMQAEEPKKKRGRPRKETSDRAPDIGSSKSASKIEKELQGIKQTFDAMFMAAGSMLSAVEPFDGAVLMFGGPNVTDALISTARNDARLREALVTFCQATGYTQLIAALMGLILPIAAHHNYAPGIMIMMAPEQAVNVHMDMVQKASARKNGNGAYVNGN